METYKQLLAEFTRADEAWQRELVAAFGKRACDRRYDLDRSAHPAACNAAFKVRDAARVAWESVAFKA